MKDSTDQDRALGRKLTRNDLMKFYTSFEWTLLSRETRKARGHRCDRCGATPEHGARIVCDHIKPLRRYWHLRLDVDNVQALCSVCNGVKGGLDETDWRAETALGLNAAEAHPLYGVDLSSLKMRQLGPQNGVTREEHLRQLRERRRKRDRESKRAKRNRVPREQYEAQSLSRTRPWEVDGVSRATWYNRKRREDCSCAI